MPKSHRGYWSKKIAGNVERDERNRRALEALGWNVVTIWECALEEGIENLLAQLNKMRAGQDAADNLAFS
jgi:DNA mismatch endonuclease (patch repair protein)